MECFATKAEGVAAGANKTLINLFNPAVSPTSRGAIFDILIGSSGTPGDQAAKFALARTTGLGTEGSGFVPNNLDPAGPAGAYDSGVAHSVEPTYTANKELLVFGLNQRALARWVAGPGFEIKLAATQNNGAGLKTIAATSTQAHDSTVLFKE